MGEARGEAFPEPDAAAGTRATRPKGACNRDGHLLRGRAARRREVLKVGSVYGRVDARSLEDPSTPLDRRVGKLRDDGAWLDDHDADPEGLRLDAEGVAESLQGELGRAVGAHEGHAHPPRHGAHVHDAAAPLGPHRREDLPAHLHRREHVHLELPTDRISVEVLHGPELRVPRVIHEGVDPTRSIKDFPRDAAHGPLVDDVELEDLEPRPARRATQGRLGLGRADRREDAVA